MIAAEIDAFHNVFSPGCDRRRAGVFVFDYDFFTIFNT